MKPPEKDSSSTSCLRVLHLDDEPFELERVAKALEHAVLGCSFVVDSVDSVEKFTERIASGSAPDIVLLDIHLEASSRGGISLVQETRKVFPDVAILMCSGMDDVSTIVECLNSGADDFLSKRSDKAELSLRIFNSFKLAKLKRGTGDSEDSKTLGGGNRLKPAFAGIVMERISKRISLIINSAISAVHVEGESGTGKEIVADLFAYHLQDQAPFVKVNCGAITPTLLESELFGHVRGAFTGAVSDKKGLIESASGGWIFLDEVASLSASAQVALLRVLENQELMRVGSTTPRSINVRVLSATNEPLPALVKEGRFRKDLWQRLCETEILLSSLRERPEEIEILVKHFCEVMPGGPYQITEPALEVLSNLPWRSGNVRELRNCLRAMTELHVNKLLTPLAIPERIWKGVDDSSEGEGVEVSVFGKEKKGKKENVSDFHEIRIALDDKQNLSFDSLTDLLLLELIKKLTAKQGKLSLRRLAKAVGLSRSTLSARLKGLVQKNLVQLEDIASTLGNG